MGKLSGEKRRCNLGVLIVAGLSLLLAEVVNRAELQEGSEALWYDLFHLVARQRAAPQHTVLIAVDDQTLIALKDEPIAFWGPHFARAMAVLAKVGVKAIGLDYLYTVSAEALIEKLELPDSTASRSYDLPLRAQLASGLVILISKLVSTPEREVEVLFPPPDQVLALPGGYQDTGVANLPGDDDGVVRHFFPAVTPDVDFPGVGFGVLLALRAAGAPAASAVWELAGEKVPRLPEPRRIGYLGPPGTITSLSLSRLLAADAATVPEIRALQGKVAIIAAAESGSADRHFTPYSRRALGFGGGLMSGGELHANVVETLLTGRYPRSLGAGPRIAWSAAFVLIASASFFRLRWTWGLGMWLALSVGCALLGFALFLGDWTVPVASVQTSMLSAWLLATGVRLTGEERHRSRLTRMFGRYVSDDVVEHLLAQGHIPDMGGERMTLTVLFSDIRGFTTLSERLSPEEVVELLNRYFTRVTAAILERGGTVDKYIGDAVMAVFGAPVAYPDHARRACAAAVAMTEEAKRFGHWMQSRFPRAPAFAIGVGLHTGEAVVGSIGSERRADFTTIGDTVNIASRLEGQCKVLNWPIVASRVTLEAAGAGLRVGGRRVLQVKGRRQAIEVGELLGIHEPADPATRHARPTTRVAIT